MISPSRCMAASEALADLRDHGRLGRASTLTSADRLQLSHVAVTARTPFWRMFARSRGQGTPISAWRRFFFAVRLAALFFAKRA